MELEVLERVILGSHRQPVLGRVGRDPVRDRPRGEHAVVLEPEIPVQAGGVVLLDHEPGAVRGVGAVPRCSGGLRRLLEVALGAVGAELLPGHEELIVARTERTIPARCGPGVR